jgi:hypothetical protein
MRVLVPLCAIVLLVPAICPAQTVAAAPAPQALASTRTAPDPGGQRADALPVKRVVLYKNGIGYFEHLGRVRGNQAVTIDFTSEQLNDVLKSLTTLDLGNGRITAINYNSEAPLNQQLSALGLPLGEVTAVSQFFGALRGTRVEARTPGGVVSGRLLTVEKRTRTRGDKESQEVDELSLVTDAGEVRLVELSPAVSVRLVDRDINQQVGRYLRVVASALQQSVRRMTISTAGSGERPLLVSYVSEVPVWKTTYRLVVPSKTGARPFLQGWAIVDNTIGEDWTAVEMSLVAGAPQSFIQQISQPYYVRRPVVPLPESAALTPQTHQAALFGGTGNVSGRVIDSQGGSLPGVTVRAIGPGGAAAGEATTGRDGHYTIALPPGTYQLWFELQGFRTTRFTDVEVASGDETEQNAAMEVAAVQETVSITAGNRPRRAGFLPAPPPAAEAGLTSLEPAASERLANLQVAASGRELGDLFEYRIKEPVTIRKNQSALVPTLNSEVGIEKVTIWSPSSRNPVPLRGVWLTNSTSLTLDGGSFTVLESETFAGEGLMDSLKPGEKRLLSYAADTAVRVEAKLDGGPQRVERVRINRGTIVQTLQDQERRIYTVRNEDAAPRTVIIEHPARPGWILSARAPQPAELAAGVHRFRLQVEPKKTATLTVEETYRREVRVAISGMTDDALELILRGAGANPALEAALKPVIEKKQAIAAINRDLAARKVEMDRIAADQQRVTGNMKALKGSAEEKALIQRYTRQLDEQENRLEVIRRETADLEQQRSKAQAELDKLIEGLTLEVDAVTEPSAGNEQAVRSRPS